MRRGAPHQRRFARGRLLIIFGPVLALGVFTVLLALAAGLLGFYRYEMYAVAVALGTMVMLLAVFLFYHQTSERRASERLLNRRCTRPRKSSDRARSNFSPSRP